MDLFSLYPVLLGVLHGVDPSRGWLFVAYAYHLSKSRLRAIAVLLALWFGHSAGLYLSYVSYNLFAAVKPALAVALLAVSLLPLFVKTHGFIRPWSKTGALFTAALLAGVIHGGGLMLGALCGFSNAAFFIHIATTLAVMGAMAAIASLSVSIIRRVWINYDYIYAATGIAISIYLLLA